MDFFGTPMERGRIISITVDGARVASTDRPGIVTKPLKSLFQKPMVVGWPVFFLEYENGEGVVLCHQNPEITRDEITEGPTGKSAYDIWLDNGNTGTETDFLVSLIGADGVSGIDGKYVISAIFVSNDLVFTLSDNSTVTITGAKTLLTGPAGSNATVTKPAVETVLTGTITSHNHSGTYAAAAHNHTKANITDFPASMPASDVYTWAKAASKPAYNYTEVGAVAAAIRSNWNDKGIIGNVVGQMAWKNYGNNHTIFDASASLSPDGTAVNNTNATNAWTPTYPTLMGWNGGSTYGVRVDSARIADSAGYANSAGAAYPYRVGGVVMNFNWSGQGGQPPWLWGGSDGTNMYVYNPSNFSVARAENLAGFGAAYAASGYTIPVREADGLLRATRFVGTLNTANHGGGASGGVSGDVYFKHA